jgi:hypothetical protein
MRSAVAALALGAALATPALGACGAADESDVTQAAQSFYDAVGSGQGAAACRELAPPSRASLEQSAGQPCDRAILGEHLPPADVVVGVDVHGQMALVRWRAETTFLARYADGWRVFAAGCTPPPERSARADRFDCTIQGG